MKLPDIRDFNLGQKTVLLRIDTDVPFENGQIKDDTRLVESLPTINHLLAKGAKVIILGHLGRPEGKLVEGLSLKIVAEHLEKIINRKVFLMTDFSENQKPLSLFENLRFWPGEEKNDSGFAKKLAFMGDFYVNDSFATCHREHASIVGLPKLLPHAAGLDLLWEMKVLSSVREQPKRPVVVVIGGVKKDKLESVPGFLEWADLVLIGGKLVSYPEAKEGKNPKKKLADLGKTGEDITLESAMEFVEKIKEAGTIIWSGPLGKVEDRQFEGSTKIFAEAVVSSKAFRIVGGGDTEAALTRFGLTRKMDFVSSGGGAMLEYLAYGDLPGLKALRLI